MFSMVTIREIRLSPSNRANLIFLNTITVDVVPQCHMSMRFNPDPCQIWCLNSRLINLKHFQCSVKRNLSGAIICPLQPIFLRPMLCLSGAISKLSNQPLAVQFENATSIVHLRASAKNKSLSLACPLAHLLCCGFRYLSRYESETVPRRRTKSRRNLVDLFLTGTLTQWMKNKSLVDAEKIGVYCSICN